jgi:ABC-type glycerol-3-phosphate transport system permease component
VRDQEILSAPVTEFIPTEQSFSVSHENLEHTIPESIPLAAATASIFVVVITAVGRVISTIIHAFIFSWILAALGMQIVWRKLVQLMLHITVAAETINLIALLLYRNTSFPMFETAFLGITFLVLRSLRRPSA